MIKYEDNCVGCTSMGLHCRQNACPNYEKQKVVYCDKCGDDGVIYQVEKEQLCSYCIANKYEKDFIRTFWADILEQYAGTYADDNYEVIN